MKLWKALKKLLSGPPPVVREVPDGITHNLDGSRKPLLGEGFMEMGGPKPAMTNYILQVLSVHGPCSISEVTHYLLRDHRYSANRKSVGRRLSEMSGEGKIVRVKVGVYDFR